MQRSKQQKIYTQQGDSPTGYEATIKSVHNGLYDEDLDILGADTISYLEEQAIEVFVDCGEGYHG